MSLFIMSLLIVSNEQVINLKGYFFE